MFIITHCVESSVNRPASGRVTDTLSLHRQHLTNQMHQGLCWLLTLVRAALCHKLAQHQHKYKTPSVPLLCSTRLALFETHFFCCVLRFPSVIVEMSSVTADLLSQLEVCVCWGSRIQMLTCVLASHISLMLLWEWTVVKFGRTSIPACLSHHVEEMVKNKGLLPPEFKTSRIIYNWMAAFSGFAFGG